MRNQYRIEIRQIQKVYLTIQAEDEQEAIQLVEQRQYETCEVLPLEIDQVAIKIIGEI